MLGDAVGCVSDVKIMMIVLQHMPARTYHVELRYVWASVMQGDSGIPGERGVQGERGRTGLIGPMGRPGQKGDPGPPGQLESVNILVGCHL